MTEENRIGSTIDVAGVPFSVQTGSPGKTNDGFTDVKTRTIRVDPELWDYPEYSWEVIFHEWVHGVLNRVGLAEAIDNEQHEDALCTAIGNALHQLIQSAGIDPESLLVKVKGEVTA